MKNKIVSLFSLFIIAAAFTSCDNGDDVTGIVQVNKPTMTIDFPTAISAAEGTTIPLTVNLSAPVGKPFNLYIVLDQPNSTANGSDSDVKDQSVNTTFQKVIEIPAFVTTYSDVITINEDELTEGNEILKLNVGDSRTSAVIFTPVVSTVTITNAIKDELVLDFKYDKSFTGTTGYTNTLCKITTGNPAVHYDIDYLLLDDAFADTGNTDAQTDKCVESMTIGLADYADGLYHVVASLYKNAGLDQTIGVVGVSDFAIPTTVDYLRAGSINKGTFTQEAVNQFTATTPEGTLTQVVDVKISTVNGVRKFTVQSTDPTNPVIAASGKLSSKVKIVSKHKK